MRRLYLRIYLAVLASIVMSVILAGVAWRVVVEPQGFAPHPKFFSEVAATILPPVEAPPAATRAALERWKAASGFDMALLDPRGALIAEAGDWGERPRRSFGRHQVALPDGRVLIVQSPAAARGPWRGLGWLLALAAIALVVAVCAWPVVRRLTRDLERLDAGVAAFGAGDLTSRITVKGRDEVAHLAATFNETAARIETLVHSNRALLANASHELRSPLARLRMSVESLGPDTPPAVRAEIGRNIRELDGLVEEILTSSRLVARAADALNVDDLELRPLAAEECSRTGAGFNAGPGSDTVVRADARLVQRLMRNLLENAARYGGGAVEASLYRDGQQMRFDVCDRGPGVAEAERERIFEPFYRPAGASERSGGVGLGLALVRQIARAHGGDAACLPRVGGGACFRVWLPL